MSRSGREVRVPRPANGQLTEREREIYAHLLRAQSDKEISAVLGISPRTVRFHVSNVLEKYGARNRVELIASLLGQLQGRQNGEQHAQTNQDDSSDSLKLQHAPG